MAPPDSRIPRQADLLSAGSITEPQPKKKEVKNESEHPPLTVTHRPSHSPTRAAAHASHAMNAAPTAATNAYLARLGERPALKLVA